jgi:hypothetical protein
MQPMNAPYPAGFTFDPPEKIANWRPLVQWFLAIPHFAVLYGLRIVSQAVGLISWVLILFTGKLPDGLANIQAMYFRYNLRTSFYAAFLVEEYPPFTFAATPADPGDVPRLRIDFRPELENRNRVTVGFRIFLVIPHFIVLFFLYIAAVIVLLIAFFAVLFTGRWPAGMRDFVLGVSRWSLRVQAYFALLTDVYPPFSLD